MNKPSKLSFIKVFFKIYNIFATIIGHIAILVGFGVGIYFLYINEKLYAVLIGIILLLIGAIIIIATHNYILKRKLNK